MPNLVNAERISVAFGTRTLLDDLSLGLGRGDVVGVVGRNGDGKTTLLQVLTGVREPDSGRVVRTGATSIGYLRQAEDVETDRDRARRDRRRCSPTTSGPRRPTPGRSSSTCWAGSTWTRRCVGSAAVSAGGSGWPRCCWPTTTCWCWTSRPTTSTSRRSDWLAERAAALADPGPRAAGRQPRPLVPGRHLHPDLGGARRRRRQPTTAATRRTCWPGPSAARQAAGMAARRKNLLRKELAWLRRGPPARTSKPKFRIDAANTLIADEPPPRDRLELQQLATRRLGKDVFDLNRVSVTLPDEPRVLLRDLSWSIGPGAADRHRRGQRLRQDHPAPAAARRAAAGLRHGQARPDPAGRLPQPDGGRAPRIASGCWSRWSRSAGRPGWPPGGRPAPARCWRTSASPASG